VPERVVVGQVGRPHGLDGSFVVEHASEDGRWFKVGSRLHAGAVEVQVVSSRHGSGGRPVIKLDADVARGTRLEVPHEALPPTEDDEYYVFELIGLEVVEEPGERSLGRVKRVIPGVANDALELEDGLLLPLVGQCVNDIDISAGRILVARGFSDPA
jgi:16S rRNA processing protein RimM